MFSTPKKDPRRTVSSHQSDRQRSRHHRSRHTERPTEEHFEPKALVRYNTDPTAANPRRRGSTTEVSSPVHGGDGKEVEGIIVELEDLQATIENLRCVIKEKGDVHLSSGTVCSMLESLYEWMVFDENCQIVVPSEPGSTLLQKMWPQGSKVDTRKKKDKSTMESSLRRLREVDDDCASTVASSVISSSLAEEERRVKKGSIVYPSGSLPPAAAYTQSALYHPQDYTRGVPMHTVRQSGYGYDGPPYISQMRTGLAQTFAPVPLQETADQRYSALKPTVEAPLKVQETPQSGVAQLSRRKVRRPKVGAAARPADSDDEDPRVEFAD